ncbi:MAG: helical backbone metal receptor, partial [Ferruginibacter sp.]
DQIESLANDFPVLLTDVNNLVQALEMIEMVGKITKRTPQASVICNRIKVGFQQLTLTLQNKTPIPAAYLIWKSPYITIGRDNFIHDMMIHAGFSNVFDKQTRYPEVTVQDIRQSTCKVLLLSSEPYPFKQADIDELNALLTDVQILLVNGEMFSWYGSLLLEAPSYFEQLMHKIQPYATNK